MFLDKTPLLKDVHVPHMFSSVQFLNCVRLFATPWTAARQAFLSITNSQSLLKLKSIESVMPSNHLILCCPLLLLPSIIRVFSNESVASGGQSTGVSVSASVLPMNNQDWFPSGWSGLVSFQSSLTPQFKSINSSALSFLYSPALTSIHALVRGKIVFHETGCWCQIGWGLLV